MRRRGINTASLNASLNERYQMLKQEIDTAKLYQAMEGGVAFKHLKEKMDAIVEQSRTDTDEKPEVSQQFLDFHRGFRTGIKVVFDEVAKTIEDCADAVEELETITSAQEEANRRNN